MLLEPELSFLDKGRGYVSTIMVQLNVENWDIKPSGEAFMAV